MLCGRSAEEVYEICTKATYEFVHEAGFEDVVVGLSGGIDSSLVATIATDALGASHVHGVMLPGPYSSESSITDAQTLASNLKISSMQISIDEPYKAFAHVLSMATGESLGGVAAENTQARCRTVCLMALSNARDWMMLNTGNKSEAAMGYSTLYGDTAGAFAPIGGLYKCDVYELARWRNDSASKAGDVCPIPNTIIVKAPSAELAPNQADELSMGIDYKTLDAILASRFELNMSIEEIVEAGFARQQVNTVLNRYDAYAFKRAMEPPFPEVSSHQNVK